MKYNFSKFILLIISAILGLSAGLLTIFTAVVIDISKIFAYLRISGLLISLLALISSFAVIISVWYLISRRLYSGDKKILFLSFLVLIIISSVSTNFSLDLVAIGPKGEQIPMYALIFRGYEVNGKKVVDAPWEKYDWSFYEPHGYKEKYSRKYRDRIYVASFYYQEKQKAEEAFNDYKTLFLSNGFNNSNFDVKVNNTEKLRLIGSFAFENTDFIYSEFIGTKDGYLPGYYIIVIKSNIDEKQLVKTIVQEGAADV